MVSKWGCTSHSHMQLRAQPRTAQPDRLGQSFPLGGILRLERNFNLSCDFSGGTN